MKFYENPTGKRNCLFCKLLRRGLTTEEIIEVNLSPIVVNFGNECPLLMVFREKGEPIFIKI